MDYRSQQRVHRSYVYTDLLTKSLGKERTALIQLLLPGHLETEGEMSGQKGGTSEAQGFIYLAEEIDAVGGYRPAHNFT